MKRDADFLLNKYYNKYGQEKFVKGERWSNDHMNEHFKQQRKQQKLVIAQELGFRLSSDEKKQVAYIIDLVGNDFNKINRSLSQEQILLMIICFLRISADESCNKHIYYKKMREYDISDKMFISFLIFLLKEYRA